MDKSIKDLDVFEVKLGAALKATGHLFPTTDSEVEYFMAHAQRETVPEKYQSPGFIFKDEAIARVRKKACVTKVRFTGTAQTWAMAARNGKDLPQSILDKMKEDKKNSLKK